MYGWSLVAIFEPVQHLICETVGSIHNDGKAKTRIFERDQEGITYAEMERLALERQQLQAHQPLS